MNDLDLESLKKEYEAAKTAADHFNAVGWDRNSSLIAGGILLLFCILLFGLIGWLVKSGISSNNLLRLFTVPLVCVMAVFIILLGYTQEQIAPVIGLLGTVVGYLLGKGDSKDR